MNGKEIDIQNVEIKAENAISVGEKSVKDSHILPDKIKNEPCDVDNEIDIKEEIIPGDEIKTEDIKVEENYIPHSEFKSEETTEIDIEEHCVPKLEIDTENDFGVNEIDILKEFEELFGDRAGDDNSDEKDP